jgi:Zn-dependent M28 family amino/carboxypeptidase
MKNKTTLLITIILLFGIISITFYLTDSRHRRADEFNGQLAFEDVKYQIDLGPRTLGSDAHRATSEWIESKLEKYKWQVETQVTTVDGLPVKNIIAKRGSGTPWIIIASHYDSRLFADRDLTSTGREQPVPGANDGASTVAILLELARVLPHRLNKQVWLVFFDAEDYANISGNTGNIGAQYFVDQLTGKPDSVVVLDMVGDKDLNIYMEQNSNPGLNNEIWGVASELGYSQFIKKYKYDIIDDHIPFIRAGIKAVDIIDFDYPYCHNTQDTLDKVSPESLKIVGETILTWLEQDP